MKKLIITSRVEWHKIKGLGLTYLAIALGGIVPLLTFAEKLFNPDDILEKKLPYSIFEKYISNDIKTFTCFILLAFVIISASRIAQIDYKNNCWQLMETQPVKKINIYFSKYIVLLGLNFLCITTFFVLSIIFSLADFYIHPDPAKMLALDPFWMLKTYLREHIIMLGVTALQLFISVAFSGFIWSFMVGFMGFISNAIFASLGKTYLLSPYISLNIFRSSFEIRKLNNFISFSEYSSLFWAVTFLIVGYFWYTEKRFPISSFLSNKKKIAFSALFLLFFSGIFYILQKPRPYKAGAEGITIKGEIETDLKVDSIKIFSYDFHKKVASIPVKNGQFSWSTTQKLPFDKYTIEYANKKTALMMGNGDWFDLKIRCNAIDDQIDIKSNRKAEQTYYTQYEQFGRMFLNILNEENTSGSQNPQTFYDAAQSDWKSNIKKLDHYVDSENLALSDDFKKYRKQLFAIKYLNEINNYRKMTSVTDAKFAPPKEFLNELNENIKNPSYLSSKDDEYLQYKLDKILNDRGSTLNPDSLLFIKLDLLPQGLEKDRLLAKHLTKNIEMQTDSISRNKIFTTQINKVQSIDYRNKLYALLKQINLSQKGSQFPDLTLFDTKDKVSQLSKYKGKYVVIDLWATWCGPCREIRPVFDTRSYQYRYYKNVQFISISIDENKTKWTNYLKTKPSQVPQYWLPNADQFIEKYKIETIPRFIIIDPGGKIFNFNTPSPDEDNFVEILQKLYQY
jgi:thiol-disulfide isomerase/thioredoxin